MIWSLSICIKRQPLFCGLFMHDITGHLICCWKKILLTDYFDMKSVLLIMYCFVKYFHYISPPYFFPILFFTRLSQYWLDFGSLLNIKFHCCSIDDKQTFPLYNSWWQRWLWCWWRWEWQKVDASSIMAAMHNVGDIDRVDQTRRPQQSADRRVIWRSRPVIFCEDTTCWHVTSTVGKCQCHRVVPRIQTWQGDALASSINSCWYPLTVTYIFLVNDIWHIFLVTIIHRYFVAYNWYIFHVSDSSCIFLVYDSSHIFLVTIPAATLNSIITHSLILVTIIHIYFL